jgi:hypothetical protein
MSLGVLKSLLERRADASRCKPVTPGEFERVTPKPAPVLACTPVTPVTPCGGDAELRAAGNPLMTREADECHAGGWDDTEIQVFTARVMLFMRRGLSAAAADDLAERLVLRGRVGDDRRLCLECRHGQRARCPDGTPLPADVSHRCPTFEAQLEARERLRLKAQHD